MPVRSAGLLLFRRIIGELEVLLVHPGGPFWTKKDEGAWSIPKGLVELGEDDLAAAVRETREELGVDIDGHFTPLGEYRQPGGKTVVAWCIEADPILDVDDVQSSTFTMEWPPKSGLFKSFPEVDRAGWFTIDEAAVKILKGQRPMLASLDQHLRM
ncbi:NUDIX domain-containing protein [Pararhizobium sp. PWRC1-1]|uniref:NUDIX domain-containing protein n=1 Tax=Pararhizobium sp. PWRC1-1 TaxID=2804566 RepID=UPI003CFA9704